MKDKNLLKRLSNLGFPLFEPEETQEANATLADVFKSKDVRLWEGFPVVLANSAEKGMVNYDKLKPDSLVILSLALYKALNLRFFWADKLYRTLSVSKKKEYENFLGRLRKNQELKVAGYTLSSERLKATFNNYFNQAKSRLNELVSRKEELNLEYALSQVFSPKQKELFLNKLRGEKLTKTEREYFSRIVKKKVLALANPELHRLAQRLLE
jgi:hypothetical protein